MEAKMQFKDKNELVKALSDLKEEPIYTGTLTRFVLLSCSVDCFPTGN
jgi:hypothetical protein